MGGCSTDWGSSSSYKWKDDEVVTRRTASSYAKKEGRTYDQGTPKGIDSPVGLELTVESAAAAMLVLDVTGSMDRVPKMVMEKLGPAYHECNAAYNGLTLDELKEMDEKDVPLVLEMGFMAVGDAQAHDQKPLQVVPFSKGAELANGIKKVWGEGGGGPYGMETYELAAYFLANHVKIPKGVKPVCTFICDERFYNTVKPNLVKEHIGDNLSKPIPSADVFKKLKKKFDVYAIRLDNGNSRAQTQWEKVLGPQRVMKAENADRIVDNFILINHIAAENYEEGVKILERKQVDPKKPQEGLRKMGEVLKTLHPLLGKKADKEMDRLTKKYKGGK
jgi:hypothetical protein